MARGVLNYVIITASLAKHLFLPPPSPEKFFLSNSEWQFSQSIPLLDTSAHFHRLLLLFWNNFVYLSSCRSIVTLPGSVSDSLQSTSRSRRREYITFTLNYSLHLWYRTALIILYFRRCLHVFSLLINCGSLRIRSTSYAFRTLILTFSTVWIKLLKYKFYIRNNKRLLNMYLPKLITCTVPLII